MKTSFFEDVYDVVRLIPKGRITSYGAIAKYLGSGGSARMVGWAMNAVADRNDVPAHRVVNRSGLLTGKMHFGNPEEMQKRLEKDGLKVVNDKVSDFNDVFWDPMKEL